MAEFVMPALGADMEAGRLIAWMKKPGERIERGEIIAEIDTDKGLIEVECFAAGVVEKLLINPGDSVPVGTVLAIIREEGRKAEEHLPETARLKISPVAKKMAAELGIDPATITGTGPEGRITHEDVERAAAAGTAAVKVVQLVQPPIQPEDSADRAARMRQAIAAAMARSKREIPHYYLSATIDMSRAITWLAEENQKRPVERRLLLGPLLVKAVALALHEVPELNGFWKEGRAVPSKEIHIGMAISLRGGGLIAPALHNADKQSIDELMKNLRDLSQRARALRLRSSELSDPTITLTSLGEQGVETVFGVIYPPQVAIVGFGKVVERPWAANGMIGARQVITATLAADHRASDGHRGGRFLAALDRLLQEPEKL
ncbi:MAG: 2-oxo acid dehydrogenase subunit E2 [Acidobacteria bacterium]|nr:2-oxo acid dehydrogenase subunit E2 [Acidobacteriota bacterium]